MEDGSSDFSGFIGASLSLADGTDLGGVFTMDPVIFSPTDPVCPFGAQVSVPNVPVLTPIALAFNLSAGLSLTAGHGLAGVGRAARAACGTTQQAAPSSATRVDRIFGR